MDRDVLLIKHHLQWAEKYLQTEGTKWIYPISMNSVFIILLTDIANDLTDHSVTVKDDFNELYTSLSPKDLNRLFASCIGYSSGDVAMIEELLHFH